MMQFGDGFVGAGDLENYNPADPEFGGTYTLTTHTGLSYTIDPTQGVIDSVSDLNNNTLTYTNNGVFSSSGATLTFTRDYRGRITSATATNANGTTSGQPILYQYDNNGNLVSVTDQAGQTTTYSYGQGGAPIHYLTGITDPQGNAVLSANYDPTNPPSSDSQLVLIVARPQCFAVVKHKIDTFPAPEIQ
jgi:YD repeat-containing protein